ncbi:helix-turn-helix domain-containing protein [Chitinophaga ginsengisoli]|uniref:AraC-like DNA-binding protein n=1 Tax=Chitinophaga ginsengisoli TaxID=363837 RepID=A0A2P8G106_9BACT|nr:helix-turn-helix transcriptional regulator [Chitinophaga ginsengisoli]PSL27644.1 AraC-like DNA-binding protein [Chitinophaga ginsengisoli]
MSRTIQSWDAHSCNPTTDHYPGPYFNVYTLQEHIRSGVSNAAYTRRDYYKIMLFSGECILHFGDQSITIGDNTLLFLNSRVPYTFELLKEDISGYSCVFKDEFFREGLRLKLEEIPLFMPDARPVFALEGTTLKEVTDLFEKILREFNSTYAYRYELISSYVSELIYYAMKLVPAANPQKESNATARVTTAFLDLLERQFPVELFSSRILLRSPKDFADRLSIHVNYLNRAVKTETGKTTTDHIFDRLVGEAKAMLKHTNLNIAEISFALGFEDQAHFNNFFKKRVKVAPSLYRQV